MTSSVEEQLKLLQVLKNSPVTLSNERICELTDHQQKEYNRLLDEFITAHTAKTSDSDSSKDLRAIKGRSLEAVSRYLLQISGGIFEVDSNLRTTTNEIDLVLKVNPKGAVLIGLNLLDARFYKFLGECKNYSKKLDVTYTGKFCSLMLTTQMKFGILFSYYGVTGTGWNDASGLIKKFYLHKENELDRYCVIDFNITDFTAINNGHNLLDIITAKLLSLQLDTNYAKYLSAHPAEKQSDMVEEVIDRP